MEGFPHPLELHQEDLFRSLGPGRMDEHRVDPGAGELLEQQGLIGILAAEPGRGAVFHDSCVEVERAAMSCEESLSAFAALGRSCG